MVAALRVAVTKLPTDVDGVYHECQPIDRGVVTVRRTFTWYAEKYDQRLDGRYAAALLAADEVVRSCWTQPFVALGRSRPTGPLVYLDNRFDAFATPRVSVPPDLRAPADAIVADYVRELPIPTIALPAWAASEAWWLVLAAHETGHLVQSDLCRGLEAATGGALADAVADPDGHGDLADLWSGWAAEAFADAYSVLMVGDQAAWAIDELQHGTPADLVRTPEPGDRYPPPAVRLALLGELGKLTGVGGSWPTAAETAAWLDGLAAGAVHPGARAAVKRHLAVTPVAASALLSLPVSGSTLRTISGLKPQWFAANGRVRRWSRHLLTPAPSFGPVSNRFAARQAVAAGVLAWTTEAPTEAATAILHRNLMELLPKCGETGFLATPPALADVAAAGARIADRLLDDMADAVAKDVAP